MGIGISFRQKGDFKNTENYLKKLRDFRIDSILNKYGEQGVMALMAATPVDTGKTANSWSYKIKRQNGKISLEFHNSNVNKGVPIAIILQYGHATGNGGWVEGRDYINPALQPIFDELSKQIGKEVERI